MNQDFKMKMVESFYATSTNMVMTVTILKNEKRYEILCKKKEFIERLISI